MEHQDFITGYRYMREANISQAMVHFCIKPNEWLEEHIPLVAYELPIYNFIKFTGTMIALQSNVDIYEVNGQWQRITIKDSIPT